MSLIAISDLHISGPEDPLYRSLIELVKARASRGGILVLVGDVFDLFVGSKPLFIERYAELFSELRAAGERGVEMHYIEGNHDFLIRRSFGSLPGMSVHPHHVAVDYGGRRFYFAHGDTVDRTDYGYRALRVFFRSPVMKAFVRLSPGRFIDWLGKRSSEKSRKSKPRLPASLPTRRIEHLRKAYRSFAATQLSKGFDFVVLGHCHDLDEMFFQIGGRSGQYVNVGYPRVHGSFLSWTEGEEKIHREKLP